MSLYREELIEEARNPKHFGELEHAQEHLAAANPTCGDEIAIHIRWEGGTVPPDGSGGLSPRGTHQTEVVGEATFTGRGCMVTMASASRLLTRMQGMLRANLEAITEDDALKIFGDPVTPGRLDCALMPFLALRQMKKEK